VAWWRILGPSAREEEGEACEDVKETRTSSKSQAQEDLGIDDPFDESQLHIVIDFTDALIDDFASKLLGGAYDHETAQSVFTPDAIPSTRYPTMTSFFVHLCLYQQ